MNHPVEIVSQGIVAWQKLRCYNGIMNMNAVQLLFDEELVRNLESAVAHERGATVQLIALLAEMDVRRLFLEQGHSSLFVYCTKCLHLSEHAAYGRIEAARAAQKFPSILDKLTDGSITLTTICLLSNHLTEDNHERLLEAARHKTRRDVEVLVAALHPMPAHQKLRRLQDLLRHTLPSGDVAEIFDRGLTLLLKEVERQKLAAVDRPRRPSAVNPTSRHVPAAARREVWKRDQGRCAFVGTEGRCEERGFLEFHHVIPFAEGGPTTAGNLQLRCRAHNDYEKDREIAQSLFR
jgi:HNH endonuclease